MDDDECGAVGVMIVMIVSGSRSTRRKPASVPLCPPQIPRGLTRVRTRAAAVGSQPSVQFTMASTCKTKCYLITRNLNLDDITKLAKKLPNSQY
jgi:hypothetical protein